MLNEIHEFAARYLKLYSNPGTTEAELEKGFGDLCFGLGFEMDCGKSFVETCSKEAFLSYEALERIIDGIDDACFLGTAIFSKWRCITHWEESSLMSEENRRWFIAAFSRLAAITREQADAAERR